jgi:hypothetical protein
VLRLQEALDSFLFRYERSATFGGASAQILVFDVNEGGADKSELEYVTNDGAAVVMRKIIKTPMLVKFK